MDEESVILSNPNPGYFAKNTKQLSLTFDVGVTGI
jgi:hypothetical protein